MLCQLHKTMSTTNHASKGGWSWNTICVDMKRANTSIIREPYQIPTLETTLEEFCHEFNGCRIFTTWSQPGISSNHAWGTIAWSHSFCNEPRNTSLYKTNIWNVSRRRNISTRNTVEHVEHVLCGLERVKNISDDIIIGAENPSEMLHKSIIPMGKALKKRRTRFFWFLIFSWLFNWFFFCWFFSTKRTWFF